MDVLGTQQRPRIVFINSVSGSRYKFLLKGAEDLTNDQRIMQFFSLINSYLRNDHHLKKHDLAIIQYTVMPLSPTTGLIAWVNGAETLHRIICDTRKGETAVEDTVIQEEVDCDFVVLNRLQKLEIFETVAKKCNGDELAKFFWRKAANAVSWLKKTKRFTGASALMSMTGFVIGLGDRHPSNIMIEVETGNVIHIDFAESFESARCRQVFPERVHFRLTRVIERALELSVVGGLFTKLCESVLSCLRLNRWPLTGLLAAFLSEVEEEGVKDGEKCSRVVEDKLKGKNYGDFLTVEKEVRLLIEEARDPMNYLQHYPGWCPFC
jgi:phosphatidylinositol kinase/protein kinase (PI-3  family)